MQAASMGIAVEGAEVYVTDVPCVQCTKLLLQAGISKIKFMRDYRNDEFAESLLKEKQVDLVQVPFESQTAEQIDLSQFV